MSPSSTPSTLAAESVTVRAGATTLLDQVTLAALPGEVLALIGPNGAGKSTLLGALAGSRVPCSGRVTLDGLPLATSRRPRGPAWDPLALARRRAVLPQHETTAFPLSSLEVVLLGRHPHRARHREDVDLCWDALGRVDARHLATRAFPTLSGGERQRVRIARALAQITAGPSDPARRPNPPGDLETGSSRPASTSRWLLLDEPSSGLDLAQARALHALLRVEAQRGTGVIIVEHDLALAAQADRVAVLSRGRLVALGPPSTTLDRALLAEVFALDAALVTLPSGGLALDLAPLPQPPRVTATLTPRSPLP